MICYLSLDIYYLCQLQFQLYCHFKTRIAEHIKKYNKSHICKHLHSNATCFGLYNSLAFKIIDKAKFDLKIKETLHINWRNPSLNAKQNHLDLTLSPQLPSLLFFSVSVFFFFFFFFAFLFHLLFRLSMTLIIDIFYCLNYASLLLHLITTHLVSHLSLSSIIFIISMLIISIFYRINLTSLLLHLIIAHLVNIFYNNYVINISSRQLL